jgi:hypothetical protein
MGISAAYGTTLTWNSVLVGELTNVGGVEAKVDTVDVTVHGSDPYKKFIPTFIDGGEVAIEGFLDSSDAGQMAMYADLNTRTMREAIITFPAASAASWTFDAYIVSMKIGDNPVDGVIPFTANLKVNGIPNFTVVASTGLTTPFFAISNSAVITPAPSGSVYDYIATVLTGVSSVTITPTATAGVIEVNGTVVTSGAASGAVALGSAGSLTTAVITVTETGKATKTYTIRIARA